MDLVQETQAAHDDFVRAVQAIAMQPEHLKALHPALEAFHLKARSVDTYIQSLGADIIKLQAAKEKMQDDIVESVTGIVESPELVK